MSVNNVNLNYMLLTTNGGSKLESLSHSLNAKELTLNDESDDDFSAGMNVIAHRGYSAVAPENTIPAFIAAAEAGFTTVECDIEWTKDGVPVLLHDENINRTARTKNGWQYIFNRPCSSYTYEQLLDLDFGRWKDEKYKGTKIPSFEEFLDCAKEYGLNAYVELKQNDKFDEERALKLIETVKESGLEDNITWISKCPEYLQMISKYMPDARLGLLSSKEVSEETISTLQELKTEDNEVFLDIKSTKITAGGDEMLDEAGFPFEAWTINDNLLLPDLYEYECSGITTDFLPEKYINDYLEELYGDDN